MIKHVLVLGSGSAGLIAAITLKRKIPQLLVQIVRSPDIGVIGVGEGTQPNFPRHLFNYLGISRKAFYDKAQPTWKMGVRFIWGPRPKGFDYGFGRQLDCQWSDLPKPNGFYCDEEFAPADLPTALMARHSVFLRSANGGAPDIHDFYAFHIENKKLVETLEVITTQLGIEFIDGKVSSAQRGPEGISAVTLEDGRKLEADFFIDSSGFRSELLGKALQEPYQPFDKALFCDRAVIGGWERTVEPILPHTTAETMDAGWAWQIEHEHFINRGYVYSSAFISDDDARAELRRKNPKVPADARVVKFRSGRYARAWVDNVVAIGNSCGFVEPLEATALMVVCWQSQTLVEFLLHNSLSPTPTMRELFNTSSSDTWDEIRDFLAIHYRFNTRLSTPFWKHCQENTDVSNIAKLLHFYEENGPTGFCRYFLKSANSNQFGIEGFLVMLVGNRVPYRGKHAATDEERRIWKMHLAQLAGEAQNSLGVRDSLAFIRHPNWRWNEQPAM